VKRETYEIRFTRYEIRKAKWTGLREKRGHPGIRKSGTGISGNPEIRKRTGSPDPRITGYPDNRITGTGQKPCVPDPRIPGTGRSKRLTSYLLPLTSALFTAFLMIHTAAVLSSPQSFITGGGGSSLLS